MKNSLPPSPRGFSLIEVLVVLAIVSLVAVASMPSLTTLILGSALNRAGQSVAGELSLARQEAMTRNCEIEVRFYRIASLWTAVQIWRVTTGDNGDTFAPVRPPLFLPSGIIMSEPLSPLIASDTAVNGQATLPVRIAASYRGFRFRPTGSASAPVTDANNYVTLQEAHAQGSPPANYCTLQVSPLSGNVAIYRP
ncbi:Verru_Chthon cassette protein D [Verrucomicrobium sp. GAS474]|uniref:Verru_Chthon cassette protein D n=1 Tax=Verrucomicrobium sp. GAS474 TaxID=1882831 RepID=UPI00087DA7E0|nr:Verru_Chthon cassette protein D [Verrucomicrobium sp. GAS474]SDT92815.1 Verru_Chthon cassette protein D [Verrucomicrobium sp. GAS474]